MWIETDFLGSMHSIGIGPIVITNIIISFQFHSEMESLNQRHCINHIWIECQTDVEHSGQCYEYMADGFSTYSRLLARITAKQNQYFFINITNPISWKVE